MFEIFPIFVEKSDTVDYKGITTFKAVASKFLLRTQRPISDYKRAVSITIDGYRDINLFHLGNAKKARLQMNDISCIDLPDDYQTFISLSIPVNGTEYTFTKDGSMVSPTAEVNGVEVLLTDDQAVSGSFSFGSYASTGGNNDFYYMIEESKRRIVINGVANSTVTLTYISTGISMTEETAIPKYTEEALIAWLRWKFAENDPGYTQGARYSAPMNKVMYEEDQYYKQLRQIDFLQSATIEQIYDAIYSTWKQTPKR